MTHRESAVLAVAGILVLLTGLAWAFGPWGLLPAGAVMTVVALLASEKERGEPSDETVAPPA